MARMWQAAAVIAIEGLWLAGCHRDRGASGPATPPFRGLTVTVAAVDDPALLKTVAPQRGDWERTREGTVALRDGAVEPKSAASRADVLIFPASRLGDLVDAGALVPLPDSVVLPAPPKPDQEGDESAEPQGPAPPAADPLNFEDVLPAFREQVTRYGRDRLALPLGGSALVLVYRRDALSSEANRAAAADAKLALEPPKTWEEFDRLARFLHGRDWDGDGAPESALAVALGPDPEGLGEAILLARAAGPGLHPDQFSFLFDADTMGPRIELPPFVEALAALARWKDFGPPGASAFDAEAARKSFRSGEVALLIDRAERAGRWADPKAPIPVGVAALPGSPRVFDPERKAWEDAAPPNRPSDLPGGGGWLIGVSAATTGRQREAAIDLAKFLAGPEVSARIRADRAFPMLPTRTSQLLPPDTRSIPGVAPQQWAQAVAGTLTARRVIPGLRIPDAAGYLADLRAGRVAAVGGQPAAEALRDVAQAWSRRTKALGVDRQLWHYRRSLNAFETAPEPPPRP